MPWFILSFLSLIAVIAAVDIDLAVVLALMYGLVAMIAALYRLVRGHAWRCCGYWGLVGAFWWFANLLFYAW